MRDPYTVLGLSRDFSPEQLREAWRRAVLLHHPDRGGRREEFEAAQSAYQLLRDPVRFDGGERFEPPPSSRADEVEVEEILRRVEDALPDLEQVGHGLYDVWTSTTRLDRIGAGARTILSGLRAYGRLRGKPPR